MTLLSFMPINPSEIRLFLLLNGRWDDPIRGRLGAFPLEQCPPFQALSYVWGERAEGRTIEVDRLGTVDVTDNLFAALRRMRLNGGARTLWIDALCIDQKNVPERNAQVRLMREIYSQAAVVDIWLGEPAEEEHERITEAINLIHDIGKSGANLMIPMSALRAKKETWKYLNESILGLPWFYRAWTFQEAIVAKKAVAMRGSHAILWSDLLAFVDALIGPSKSIAPLVDLSTIFPFSRAVKLYREHEGLDPAPLMFSRRCCQATEPKDMVFAHLGLTREGRQNLLPVDYAMSVEQVYAAMTKLLIRQEKNLDVLTAVYHADRRPGMPSWVVDWRIPSEYNPIATLLARDSARAWTMLDKPNYTASGDLLAVDNSQAWEELVLGGKHVTRISRIYPPCFEWDSDGLPWTCVNWFDELANLGRLEKIYPWSQETYLDAFSRTLIGDQDKYTSWTDHRANGEIRSTLAFVHRHPTLQGWTSSAFLEESDWDGKPKNRINIYLHMVRKLCANRRFFMGGNGCIGLAPWEAQVGDWICVLFGGEVPFILRQKEDHHEFIGEAYCHGFMDSEAITNVSPSVSFKLR